MKARLPLIFSVCALVLAALGTVGPAVAHGVEHALFAHDSDRVDGRHAVGANASAADRALSLVAADSSGRLPLAALRGTITGIQVVSQETATNGDEEKIVDAMCPSPKLAIGGSAYFAGSGETEPASLDYITSSPLENASGPVGWRAAAVASDEFQADPGYSEGWSLIAVTICARIRP